MVRILIVTHGFLGDALLGCAAQIMGAQDNLTAISNRDLGREELVSAIQDWMQTESLPAIVLVDFIGGSCYSAARRALASAEAEYHLLCGVNLPMLMSLLTQRERLGLDELAALGLDRGKKGIR